MDLFPYQMVYVLHSLSTTKTLNINQQENLAKSGSCELHCGETDPGWELTVHVDGSLHIDQSLLS